MEELTLALDMRKDGLANLNATQLFLADFSYNIARIDFNAVQELHRVVPPVDKLYNKSVFILV